MEDRPEPPPIPRLLRTPADLPPDADGSIKWWRPTLWDIMPELRPSLWLIFILLVPVPILLFLAVYFFRWLIPFVGWFFDWIIPVVMLVGALAAVIVELAYGRTRRRRMEPYCIHCGYQLSGLPDHHTCPECGRPYSLELCGQYRQNPTWFIEQWKRSRKSDIAP